MVSHAGSSNGDPRGVILVLVAIAVATVAVWLTAKLVKRWP